MGFVDGPNQYAYAGGNPIVGVDPSGRFAPAIVACTTNPLCIGPILGGLTVLMSPPDQKQYKKFIAPSKNVCVSNDQCEEQFKKDRVSCQTMAASRGGGFKSQKGRELFACCDAIAKQRYADCIAGKPLSPFPL